MDHNKLFCTEIGGSPRIGVRLTAGEMLYYERSVLCGGVCCGIPSVQHLETEEGEFLYYDIEGLFSLKTCLENGNWNCRELMIFLGSLLRSLLEARDHLLVPELFALSSETVFCHPEGNLPRLIYVPQESNVDASFRAQWCSFLKDIDQVFPDPEWHAYSPGIGKSIREKNMGPDAILRLLQEKEGRMFQTGWPAAVLNRTPSETKEKPEDLSIFRFRVFNRN